MVQIWCAEPSGVAERLRAKLERVAEPHGDQQIPPAGGVQDRGRVFEEETPDGVKQEPRELVGVRGIVQPAGAQQGVHGGEARAEGQRRDLPLQHARDARQVGPDQNTRVGECLVVRRPRPAGVEDGVQLRHRGFHRQRAEFGAGVTGVVWAYPAPFLQGRPAQQQG